MTSLTCHLRQSADERDCDVTNVTSLTCHLRQSADERVDVRLARRLHDLRHIRCARVVAVRDVVAHADVEQNRFLRHASDLRAQPLDVQLPDVASVDRLRVDMRSAGRHA